MSRGGAPPGISVNPMTPAEIEEAERLSPDWLKPIWRAMREHGISILLLPTGSEAGLLAHPAGAENAEARLVIVARDPGQGPAVFPRELLRAMFAKADYIAITSQPKRRQEHVTETVVARALMGAAMVVDCPLRRRADWTQVIRTCNPSADVVIDHPQPTERDAAQWSLDTGNA